MRIELHKDKNIGKVLFIVEGSRTEPYATKYYLTNLGYEVNILNERYTGVYRYLHFISKNIQKAFYTLRHKGAVKYHCNLRKNKNQDSGGLTKESSKAIDHFIRRYLNPYECSYKKLKEYAWNDLTALVFAGSDQIWNCSKGIDLVCHGVPSLAFFQDYIRFLEDKNGGSIIDFSFRRKEEKTIAYTETVIFDDNGKKKIISVPSGSSSYYKLFLLGESYREACYHCNYSSINKPADITIGDYFELKQDYPDIFKKINSINGCGVSCIITNNMIGEKWINAMKNDAYIFEVDVKTVHYSHAQLCGPMKYSPLRNKIFKMYYRNGYKSVANYFYYQNIVRAFPRMVKKKLLGFRRKK